MRKLLLISLFAILVSASFVAAFSLSTDSLNYDVCRGSTSTIITSVTGSGSFDVVSEGYAALFTTTVPGSFTLNDGTQSVYSYVNPPSNTKVEEYSLDVEVSSGGEVQSQNYGINVKDCHGSNLEVVAEKLTCACEETTYSLTLENQGEFTETFDLSVDGLAEDWTVLSVDEITVNSGERKQFTATVSPPCNVHGIYELDFKAKGRESLASASGSSNLDIQPCYEYELEFDKESYLVCENVKTEVPVKIKNLGTSDNKFKVVLNGPKWTSSENNVEVASSEEGVAVVTAYPLIGDVGEYDLEVETLTDNGAVKKVASTKLVVEKCHGISAQLKSKEESICNLDGSYSYQLAITNSGNLPDAVSLELEGPEWVVLDDKKIVLNPDQERSVSIELNLPADVERKTYDINIKVSSENGAESETGFKLKIAEDTECYSSSLSSEEDSIVVGLENGKTFSLTLKNAGLEESTFKISLEGSADGFSLINPDSLTLKPGTEEQLFLFVSPPLYIEVGEYDLEIKAIVKETGLTISEEVEVKVVEKLDEKGDAVKEEDKGEGSNMFTEFFSKVWAFLQNPLMLFEEANETVTEDVEDEEVELEGEETTDDVEEDVEETVDEETEEVTEDVEEEANETVTEDVQDEEETVEEELVEEDAEEAEEVAEDVEEEETVDEAEEEEEESEEVVEENVEEESEEKVGFWSRIISFFQMTPKVSDVAEDVQDEEVEEDAEEEDVEETVDEEAEEVEEEETVEEVVDEEVVETAEVAEESTNDTNVTEEVVAAATTEEEIVEEVVSNSTEEANETAAEVVEEVVEEVAEGSSSDEDEEVVEENVNEETAEDEIEVDGTTVKIDLDALLQEDQEGRESSSFNFEQFKWYLGGALIIVALVILLSTGFLKSVIGFFAEE